LHDWPVGDIVERKGRRNMGIKNLLTSRSVCIFILLIFLLTEALFADTPDGYPVSIIAAVETKAWEEPDTLISFAPAVQPEGTGFAIIIRF
jgi:hypothetical protein